MATINIRRDVKDSFYRYKMPKIISKVEGRGNGIKTVIPNMSDIAKALHRPPAYPTKYFGCELGAQVKCDEKHDRYIVNGSHDAPKLQEILDGFISKFVLCAECLNPETDLVILKDGSIVRDCKACGKRTFVDMGHRLSNYITRNPPQQSAKGKKDKKVKKSDKNGDENDESYDPDSKQNSDDEITKRIEAESSNLPDDDKIESALDDWAGDASSEAVAARQKELGGISDQVARKLNLADKEGGIEAEVSEDPLEMLAEFLESNKDIIPADLIGKVSSLGIREDKAVAVVVQVLFNEDIIDQIEEYEKLLSPLITSDKCQKAFLGGIERVIGVNFPSLLPKTPLILKAAYDEDLVDEDIVLKWGSKPSKKYVPKDTSKKIRELAAPFLEWLENAEEESEEDSD